ncbi:hypothetical protein F441_18777 [Phytophthora nicotianae CJ01A1]|uniref:Uncharacterized protein n=3 Tax=Phytophthora nicotianae TaxID=4792 RepID=V9E6C6_PHYNI|nr:hypothetical protein F443_18967 [Phytophthora nicotianae P1569]ETK74897.1 hypothetical protein L915_18392 [Phytophthora nicotianae]ETL28321.1 hypothetical protein L916_18295 [Phytophthora nicotianae]ETP04442.1 hypothetical protein F441_18777 [Phytophthora nicotianae CJ01A1]
MKRFCRERFNPALYMHTKMSKSFLDEETPPGRRFKASTQHIPVTIPKSITTTAFSPSRCKIVQQTEFSALVDSPRTLCCALTNEDRRCLLCPDRYSCCLRRLVRT